MFILWAAPKRKPPVVKARCEALAPAVIAAAVALTQSGNPQDQIVTIRPMLSRTNVTTDIGRALKGNVYVYAGQG
jgi:hypothetical protein